MFSGPLLPSIHLCSLPRPVSVQFMLGNLTIQGISVDSKDLRGLGLISIGFGKRALDEFFFELAQAFIQINASFDHFGHKGFQLLFHNFFLRVDSLCVVDGFYSCRHQRSIAR